MRLRLLTPTLLASSLVVLLLLLTRLYDDVTTFLKWGICGISPCHVCPCPPFTWFGPRGNPHCPEDSRDLFPELSEDDVRDNGFLAASALQLCGQNPFISYLQTPEHSHLFWESEIKTEQYLRSIYFSSSCLIRPATKWDKFNLFNKTLHCPSLARYPDYNVDGTKYLCGLQELSSPCVIYSLGSRNNYLFEDSMLARTTCEIHTFDCTVDPAFHKNPKIIFHKICIGAKNEIIQGREYKTFSQLTKELGHQRVDLLKMDIEGYEYTVFQDWLPTHQNLPFQVVFELHLNFLTAEEVVMMMNNLFVMGYRVVSRDDNPTYWEGTELTLVRTRCLPAKGSPKQPTLMSEAPNNPL